MTFEEFLRYVRREIGHYCKDSYWEWKFSTLDDKSLEAVRKETPWMAINAIATDYSSKNG